ncbi:MAG TPA: B12-binding domain-containing radical SAM protein [Clostridiales bacterium]|nr:B12-binding domain-containing radical SAM protein [Clostridiales bacterium]
MKILLVAVNAKYIHSNLAIYYLKEYAKTYEEHIELAEYTINHRTEDILKGIYKTQADVVAFSCYIWNIEIITEVVVELKKVMPKVKIWFGGPEVSYNAKECLQAIDELDGITIGEGEQTFLELMECFVDSKMDLSQIKGIAYKSADDIVLTEDREAMSLDAVPFPYDDMESFRNKIIYYESSRGCPFSCSYCLSSLDRRVRLRSTELVKKELQIFLDYEIAQVKFVDRTFNCKKNHAMEIWTYIKEHDNGITNFHFEISADMLDEGEIEFLNTLRPGQVQLEIGVQSTNPQTIEAIHRKMDLKKLAHNVEKIRKGHNIHQHLDLIVGLPYEDYDSFINSFNDVYSLKADQLQLGFLKVLKGSYMETDSSNHGIVYQDRAPYEVLQTDLLSYDEILKLKGLCDMVEAYYNSGQFTYSMEFLNHYCKTPGDLYLSLSEYYEVNGLDQIGHSRIRRYEILLDFFKVNVLKENKDLLDVFEEILTLDMFLREKMKSRPIFAHEGVEYHRMREVLDRYNINRRDGHVEKFNYDVINASLTGKFEKRVGLMVFDYSRRDPLNKGAKLTEVKED